VSSRVRALGKTRGGDRSGGRVAESGAGARFSRSGSGSGPTARLRAAALRLPLGGDGIEARAAWLCVVARGEGEGAALGVRVRHAGGPAREGEIRLSSQRNRYEWAISRRGGADARHAVWPGRVGGGVAEIRRSGGTARALAEVSWRLRLEGLDRSVAYAAGNPPRRRRSPRRSVSRRNATSLTLLISRWKRAAGLFRGRERGAAGMARGFSRAKRTRRNSRL
jgi:hypothetical protein